MPETKAQTIRRWFDEEQCQLQIDIDAEGNVCEVTLDGMIVPIVIYDYREGCDCYFCGAFVLAIDAAQLHLPMVDRLEPVCPACVAKLKGEE